MPILMVQAGIICVYKDPVGGGTGEERPECKGIGIHSHLFLFVSSYVFLFVFYNGVLELLHYTQ